MRRAFVLAVALLMVFLPGCGGGGGGGNDTPSSSSDLWQGTWTLNTQETDWGVDNSELPLYAGSFFAIDGNNIRVVLIRDGLVEYNATGTFSVAGSTFTSQVDGMTLVGTFDLQNNDTKVIIYWSDAAGGDTEVYDKDPLQPVYAFGSFFLQYRIYENASTVYQAFLPMTRNDVAIREADIDAIRMFNSADNVVSPSSEGFMAETYMKLDCTVAPCVQSGPLIDHGFYRTIGALPADTYSFEVDTAEGQTLNLDVPFPGQLDLPIVPSASMQSAWSGNDLVLNWTNPTGAANWSEVDQLRIRLFDSAGKVVLYVSLNPSAQTVTISQSLLTLAAAMGNGSLTTWELQTRAYDANDMNFARGYSFRVAIAAP